MKQCQERYQFFTDYSIGTKAKIEKTILEQKKLLDILAREESTEIEEIEDNDDYRFFEENQKWMMDEI